MASPSSATTHLIGSLLRPPTPSKTSFLSFFNRPLPNSVLSNYCRKTQLQHTNFSSTKKPIFSSLFPTSSLLSFSTKSSPKALPNTLSLEQQLQEGGEEEEDEDDDDDDAVVVEGESEELEVEDAVEEGFPKRNDVKLPALTVKEKKELASYAHGLGKNLKCQLVGKSGVTDNVATSFVETLEKNELLKIKIHRTCPGELEDVVQQLVQATGSVVVGQIGRTIIVYRPSITKLKAEEKKKQARRIFVRRQAKPKPLLLQRGKVPRLNGRGRRGSSRMSNVMR